MDDLNAVFPRDLYDRSQTQDESLWESIKAEWNVVSTRFNELFASLRKSLPHNVTEFFANESFDGVIQSVDRLGPDQIAMVLNTKSAHWVTGTCCKLQFSNDQLVEGIDDVIGSWWLYDEFHPAKLGAFDLRVLCDRSEFRIVAGDLAIECA